MFKGGMEWTDESERTVSNRYQTKGAGFDQRQRLQVYKVILWGFEAKTRYQPSFAVCHGPCSSSLEELSNRRDVILQAARDGIPNGKREFRRLGLIPRESVQVDVSNSSFKASRIGKV